QLVTGATPPPLPLASRRRRKRYGRMAAAALVVAAGAVVLVVSRGQQRSSAATPGVVMAKPQDAELTPAPAEADPRPAQARSQLRALLAAFAPWAADHAAAPCPTAAELGAPLDPWGHAFALTCTDQPADQVVGARSAGPDGEMETDDDLVSWTLDDARKLAHGPRWRPTSAKPVEPVRPAPARERLRRGAFRKPIPPAPAPQPHADDNLDTDGDGIPDRRR
ncbi:MAG TPA: hypothetical protein VGD80_27010, partial [Kofleriaceae bacterium]